MEVAIPGSNNGGTPFQREVREWQRLDPNTGALLTGRLEADRWINGSLNSYGKVVDSQNVSQPNGTQHSQRKQLEVLQARTSSGSMQVIRAHTVQTTSSRWTATSSSSASSSNSSSPALMSSLSANTATTTGSGYFPSSTRFHTNLGLKNDNSATDCSGISNNGGLMVDEDHLASSSNLHMNLHAKLQQQQHHHLLSTAPSLKLSNLMKSTPSITNGISSLNNSGSQNKAILHRSNHNNNNNTSNSPSATAAGTFNRPQQRHQHSFLTSSSSRQQQQNNDSTTATATTASALLQQASSTSSMSSTSTIAPTISSRQITTTSSGSFCYDSSRYDLPTIMTDTYVGGSSVGSGRIIDICSRDLDDDDDDVVGDGNNNDRLHSSSTLSSSSLLSNRQNQRETSWQPSSVTLQRGRSISTDDLSTKNVNSDGVGGGSNGIGGSGFGDGDEDYDEPAEWRRVSKIRRSFQFPSTTASESTRPRPADLPASSVSVSKIREELENGRRLSTAMRNNHLDLVALDNILNGGGQSGGTLSPLTARKKTASFLTAESLKEIRGKLKKLSDESLYKDDFVTKLEAEREDSPEKVAPNTDADTFQYKPRSNGNVHTTNSLESRSVKYKDTSSAEWHLRRKSYGFEKMSPPDDKSMFRFENSTDSGLGRSSDLGNWSPTTDSTNSSAAARATVITFGEQSKQQQTSSESKTRPMVQRRLRNRTQPQSEAESAEMKRHSIAVDESQYVRENLRKTSAVHLNGFYSKDSSPLNSGFSDDNSRRQKRVEFCKTEVHFAAESGRVNIVETDGKPPPSNNFRRRRRSSSSSSSSSSTISSSTVSSSSMDSMSKNGLPVIHFGDERKTTFDSGNLEIGDDEVMDEKKNVTVSIPISLDRNFDSESRDGDEHQDEISIRGILKNKPPKPKPYHLGENIESSDALWGVQLKPVAGSRGFSGERDQTEEDFKEATVSSSKSVAERVRIVEERKEGTGYSTKINLNLSNSPYEWTDTSEVPQSNIMNIELHSPLTPTIKKPELIRMQAPVAKPRTSTAPTKQSTIHKQIEVQQQSQQHHQTTTKSVNQVAPHIHHQTTTTTDPNENLKIVKEARGARRLREHELSYFGIKMGSSSETNTPSDTRSMNKPKLTNNTISKRSLPSSRKLPSAAKATTTTTMEERSSSSKWSLPSDKPDLLRHSPILVEQHVITKTAIVAPSMGKQQRQRSKSPLYSSDDQTDGIYENIKQPYCRQKDLERDEMNLDEMNKSADQTMKAVSDEAAQKDLRRRSISRRSSKPLETIDEKFSKSISRTATRTKTTNTTSHRLVRECSNRPSSASSDGESLPTTPIAQRSRSKSRENVEYANLKSKSISSRPIKHRSSSGESRRSATSSTEDIAHQPRISKSVKRSSTKDEPLLVRHHRHSQPSSQQRSLRSSTESHDRHKVTPRSSTRDRVESHDHPSQQQQHISSRSHRSSHAATKSDVEPIKRSSHSSTVDSKSSTKASRSRATSENEKPSKSSTDRVSRSKAHSSQSESVRPHHRSLGSKTATMSSSGGNNSDTLIQSKNATRSTHSSSSKTAATTKRSSKDRK